MRDIIIDLQESDTWKIQLARAINFISLKDVDEERVMHTKSDSKEFMTNNIVGELFEKHLSKYQDNLGTRMEGSGFVFDSVQLLYYKRHIINFRYGGSYIDSPNWIKNTETTINSKNKTDKCFQHAVTVALNYEEIKWNLERVSNIKWFINKYISGKE